MAMASSQKRVKREGNRKEGDERVDRLLSAATKLKCPMSDSDNHEGEEEEGRSVQRFESIRYLGEE